MIVSLSNGVGNPFFRMIIGNGVPQGSVVVRAGFFLGPRNESAMDLVVECKSKRDGLFGNARRVFPCKRVK